MPKAPAPEQTDAVVATDYSDAFPTVDTSVGTVETTQTNETVTPPETVQTTDAVTPPASAPAVDPWVQTLRDDYGFQDLKDEQDARQRLLQAYREAEYQRQQMAQQWEQYRPLIGYGQEYLENQRKQQQQAAQPEPAPQVEETPWPQLPTIDPQAVQRFRNEDGSWKFNTPPSLIEAAEKFVESTTKWQQGLLYKPKETLAPLIHHEAKSIIKDILKESFGMDPQELVAKVQQVDPSSDQAYVNNLLLSNQEILFETDPRTGQRDFNRQSPWGQRLFQTVDQIMKSSNGMPEANAYYWAAKMVQSEIAQQQALYTASQQQAAQAQVQATTTAREVAATKQQDHLRRAAARSVPSRDGSVPTNPDKAPTDRQNAHEGFGRRAANLLIQEGALSQ